MFCNQVLHIILELEIKGAWACTFSMAKEVWKDGHLGLLLYALKRWLALAVPFNCHWAFVSDSAALFPGIFLHFLLPCAHAILPLTILIPHLNLPFLHI